MDGVSKVLVHSNNEAAGDEEAGRSFIELDDDGGGDDGGGDDGGDDGGGDDGGGDDGGGDDGGGGDGDDGEFLSRA